MGGVRPITHSADDGPIVSYHFLSEGERGRVAT
ncbi:hypothetical protein C497_16372 [Halalkalicoccus jeotgali B3]|uniref:Uncharacterized protein n=1 Tax=Halalkalicoccus jeotgali (strain DSM 18796 / CECT 7217 / JCM 14584 / KCTC 4019 / B3) TaxID=795797 RepID=D8J786_HALJB|nr:hypothetical protein HacjB3_02940 [Halalkalicoccus jeotgali B3]ELY33974.1 hypothetical protein C497_16372 [Halalkalicoccus jeotgali B3]